MAYPKKKLGEKAKQPRPGIPLILQKDNILKLIKSTNGNISRIAESIGACRRAVRETIQKDEELKTALENARERIIDELEDAVWHDAINGRDTGLRCFLLKTRARHRGYDQDSKDATKELVQTALEFVINKSKNPAEQ